MQRLWDEPVPKEVEDIWTNGIASSDYSTMLRAEGIRCDFHAATWI